ncbi:MAG: hypothetical protein MN733_23240 [Nitrososphaera sp.]|nr:hypothetical protein [Nitrososphaera sp.]
MSEKTDRGNYFDSFDEANAQALVALLSDPTTDHRIRMQIISEILEASKADTFFETAFAESMSLGQCPHCNHVNHWLIPEEDLNVFGFVTHERDDRVPVHTDESICKEFSEACLKKKTTI